MEFIKANNVKFDKAQITVEHNVTQSIRLQESSEIASNALALNAKKPKVNKSRITAKTMFGLKGSATTGVEGRRTAYISEMKKIWRRKQGRRRERR